MSFSECPDEDLIAAFVAGGAGGVSADERGPLVAHLAGCSACAALIAGSAPELPDVPAGAQIDRYHVLGLAGRGATGLVYAAYDPRLDRRVALKVLRRPAPQLGEGLDERLEREARAMARVSSPHVVAVHDVGHSEQGVFVAMDFVAGSTLRQWLAAAPRSRQEILAVFGQAGRGLAAAHAQGIVHRDFKPDNVLVRADGHAAVTDFGLARAAAPDSDDSHAPDVPLDLTATGALVGTPAYMAPEALRRERADHRSDIYSFCAALFEALCGRLPHVASDLPGLLALASRGAVEVPRGVVLPRPVRDALLAGLRPDPAARPSSMTALLGRLEHPRGRLSAALVGALAIAAIAIGALALPRSPPPPACAGAAGRLVGLWDAPQRAALGAALAATGSPLAADTTRGVNQAFDRYAERWIATYTEACQATRVRREASEALLDRRMACLDERRGRWAALAQALLAIAPAEVEKATGSAWDLPPVEGCLAPGVSAPPAVGEGPLVTLGFAMIARARAQAALGSPAEGLRVIAPALQTARRISYRPLEAEARLGEGVLLYFTDKRAAELALHAASVAAEACGRSDLYVEATLQLARNVGFEQSRTDEGLRLAEHAAAVAERLGEPLLVANVAAARGAIYNGSSEPARAEGYLHEALRINEAQLGSDHPRAALAVNLLAISLAQTGRIAEALPIFQRAAALRERALGREHPETLLVRGNVAQALRLVGRHDEARVEEEAVVAGFARVAGPDSAALGDALAALALIDMDLSRRDEAEAAARRSLAILEKRFGPDHSRLTEVLGILAQLQADAGDAAGAATAARAVAICEAMLPPGHPRLRRALQQQGLALGLLHRCDEALPILQRALILWGDGGDPDSAFTLDALGRCQLAQGRAHEAEATHLRAVAVREKALGPDHPFLSDSLVGLARARMALGHRPAAREAAVRAVELLTRFARNAKNLAEAKELLVEIDKQR